MTHEQLEYARYVVSHTSYVVGALIDERAALLAACQAVRELPRLYAVLESGPGGTTEELEADQRIDAILQQVQDAVRQANAATPRPSQIHF